MEVENFSRRSALMTSMELPPWRSLVQVLLGLSPPNISMDEVIPEVKYEVSPTDVALASIPGKEFNPRKRAFCEEELRPQPMIKKSRKIFVPEDFKDEKCWERCKKNNVAAKRLRDARRIKENQVTLRASFLEENATLKEELLKAKEENLILSKKLFKYEQQNRVRETTLSQDIKSEKL